jgi:hypothetical protein
MFSQKDLAQIKQKGMTLKQIEQQIENFRTGFPFVKLVAPAAKGQGIHVFKESELEDLQDYYNEAMPGLNPVKFVPASGAASRMFKHLFSFLEWYDRSETAIEKLEADKTFNSVYHFLKNIYRFAFIKDLKNALEQDGLNLDVLLSERKYDVIIVYLLTDKGLGYAGLPKGLLKFHQYDGFSRMALGEHLVEGAHYVRKDDDTVNVHFTVSAEHRKKFLQGVEIVQSGYEASYGVKYRIDFTEQKPSTDTIAVNPDNTPFREKDGSLHFRPGGHGALIENLNDLKADIIYIKNIDNVVPDRLKDTTYLYKRAIGGLLLSLQQQTHAYLRALETGKISAVELNEIIAFSVQELMIRFPETFDRLSLSEKITYLFGQLNRPIRVCGMVKNEGEPGGGPFWVENQQGKVSLQIVESSQIDHADSLQADIAKESTHFNPVDLVCAVRDYKGRKFDLLKYVDPSTGFISTKSKDGRDLKAQELPGLWNGAMADWITVFVEVPIITFNPVKTVNDLLREQHLNR